MSDANAPDDGRVLAELQARLESMPPIPAQGAGPHVEFDGNGHLVPARPGAVDPDGNNVALLASLLPQLIQVADELHALLLPQGNVAHDRLRRRLEALRAHLAPDLAQVKRDWLVFEGVRFLNAERANREAIRTGYEPAHGEDAREALDTLATLLPAFAMATAQGAGAAARRRRLAARTGRARRLSRRAARCRPGGQGGQRTSARRTRDLAGGGGCDAGRHDGGRRRQQPDPHMGAR